MKCKSNERASKIKYLQVPDTLLDAVKEEQNRAREAGRGARGGGRGTLYGSYCSLARLSPVPAFLSLQQEDEEVFEVLLSALFAICCVQAHWVV
jgi:hypothetical protein